MHKCANIGLASFEKVKEVAPQRYDESQLEKKKRPEESLSREDNDDYTKNLTYKETMEFTDNAAKKGILC